MTPFENSAGPGGLSILHLVANAGIVVQMVMLLLLLASCASWFMIDRKRSSYKRLTRIADEFEGQFWSGGEMNRIFREWSGARETEGIVNIFIAGYSEYHRLRQKKNVTRADTVDGVHRSMRVALSREVDRLETHLSFLATLGSTSPYIGLFGTVWGIMNSFRAIGVLQQVTIASVAPGISEALIATAMGLFAAIPAVIAYNSFAHTAERLTSRYEVFVEEFLSIVNRQDAAAAHVGAEETA
ncbi:MAG: Tol-Pal system protein TolQ [Arenicellales bacterium IbO2]|nr:MAG: Tol-Pal system protein TolQ [Arenicellales bacterium IbO2]